MSGDEFAIDFIDEVRHHDDVPHRVGTLMAGGETHRFEAPLGYWAEDDYRRQWLEGLQRVLGGNNSCLISWMYDPQDRYYAQWWTLRPNDSDIVIEEELFDLSASSAPFAPQVAYDMVASGPRENPDEDVSRWVVSRNAVESFLERQARRWA